MKVEQVYCPMCGQQGLRARKQGVMTLLACDKCAVEFLIVLEPQVEAIQAPSTETTH